jgi:hypothetical protein
MTEWNIQSRAHVCQACTRAFTDKQPYHTVLFDERQSYERFDVCEACWTGQYGQGVTSRKGFISHWQGIFEIPPARPDPIQRETAETLLRKLVELNDPKFQPACFILAVMLERKRVLKVKDQVVSEGRRVFIYEHPKTGDVFTVPDPNLRLDQLDEVQRSVAQLLEHGVTPPEVAPNKPVAADGQAPVASSDTTTDPAQEPAQTVVC